MDRRLLIIMIADLAGYSALMEQDPEAAIAFVRNMRERTLEPVAISAGGVVEKRMGDGWLITFPSIMQAVDVARSVQTALMRSDGLKLRLAVHIGEVIREDGELYGSGINIAARLQAQAPPGGLILSAECHRLLDTSVASDFADAGSLSLKNIKEPVACFHWRPTEIAKARSDDIPSISIAPILARPSTPEMCEAAQDLAAQLLHSLSRRTGIRVLAQDSADQTVRESTYLLRGQLRAHEGNFRAIVSLITVQSAEVFWSETFDTETDDPFTFVDHVAEQTDNSLRVQINAFDGERLEGIPEDQMTPSELRSRAAQEFHKGSTETHNHAKRFLERALTLDPGQPMSLAMLCHAIYWPTYFRFEPLSPVTVHRVVDAADAAVSADHRSDFALYTRAEIRAFLLGDYAAARKDVARSLQINPGYVWAQEVKGKIEMAQADFASACATLQTCVERSASDPYLPRRTYELAVARFLNGEKDVSLELLKDLVDLAPDKSPFWALLAFVCEKAGHTEDARLAKEKAASIKWVPTNQFVDLKLPPDCGLVIRDLV